MDSNLVIPDEFTIFQGVAHWLQNHKSKYLSTEQGESRKEHILEILASIRLPMMSLPHLCQLEKEVVTNDFHSFFMEQISKSMRYHSSVITDREQEKKYRRNIEICGSTYKTVRLKLKIQHPESRNVEVCVLVMGVQDSVQHVKNVIVKQCSFDKARRVRIFNDNVPYDELNRPGSDYLTGSDGMNLKTSIIIKLVCVELMYF